MTDYLVCPAKTEDERKSWQADAISEEKIPKVDTKHVDYAIGRAESTKKTIPLSFALLKSEEQAKEWYARNHPKYPEEVLSVMARRLAIDRGFIPDDDTPKRSPRFKVERKETEVSWD